MEAFLKANPNSIVDSNGYLRSEYEAELARRNESVAPSSSVPDPRTFRPQFECTGETEPAFELPDESPAESEVKEDLAADTVYISEHEVVPAETPELEGSDLHNIHE